MSASIHDGDDDLPDPNAFGDFGKFELPPAEGKEESKSPESSEAKTEPETKSQADGDGEAVVETGAGSETDSPADVPVEVENLLSIILRARKSAAEVAAMTSTRKEYLTIPITKPSKGKFWRVRDGEEWSFNSNSFLLLPPEFGSDCKDFLLIRPDLEDFVKSKVQIRSMVKWFGLAFMVDVFGAPSYWPLNLGDSGNWGSTARDIAEDLKSRWGMVLSGAGRYICEPSEDDLGEPVWPEGGPEIWLKRAFKDRIIDSEDHPEIKKLLGKK